MTKQSRKQARTKAGECTIPPELPDEALRGVMFKRAHHEEDAIREYMEWQAADEKVTHLEKVATEHVFDRKMAAWDVRTDKGRWWVITSPTNLYSQKLFPSLDYAITFHVGVTTRMMNKQRSRAAPEERSLASSAWRRWNQAAEALNEAEEVEEFQSIGMRCRETLLAAVSALREFANVSNDSPDLLKKGDFNAWSELIISGIASGSSAEELRHYLRSIAKTAWRLVNWLTHAKNATRHDAEIALNATEQILVGLTSVLMKRTRGSPGVCPNCGSSKLTTARSGGAEATVCLSCDWRTPERSGDKTAESN